MNLLDAIAIGMIVLAMILGVRSGALPQLLGLTGAAIAALTGLAILPAATPSSTRCSRPSARGRPYVLLGLIGSARRSGRWAGRAASKALGTGSLSALDRVAGALVGAAQAILILWLAGGVIASGPFQSLSQIAQKSTALRVVDEFLPPPTEIVLELGNLLDDSGLPDVFIGLEQLPAPEIDLPSDEVAREIGERAAPSVLRVVAEADSCSQRASGTSFVIAREYLVTNAHVVVGADRIIVQTSERSFTPCRSARPGARVALLWSNASMLRSLPSRTRARGATSGRPWLPGGRDEPRAGDGPRFISPPGSMSPRRPRHAPDLDSTAGRARRQRWAVVLEVSPSAGSSSRSPGDPCSARALAARVSRGLAAIGKQRACLRGPHHCSPHEPPMPTCPAISPGPLQ